MFSALRPDTLTAEVHGEHIQVSATKGDDHVVLSLSLPTALGLVATVAGCASSVAAQAAARQSLERERKQHEKPAGPRKPTPRKPGRPKKAGA